MASKNISYTVYPRKYAHGFCYAVLCCGYTLTDFPISIRLSSLVLWQSNDCPSASKATLMNMDKYFMWIHYERLHNHNKAKHNKTVCIFRGIYCICVGVIPYLCAKFNAGWTDPCKPIYCGYRNIPELSYCHSSKDRQATSSHKNIERHTAHTIVSWHNPMVLSMKN